MTTSTMRESVIANIAFLKKLFRYFIFKKKTDIFLFFFFLLSMFLTRHLLAVVAVVAVAALLGAQMQIREPKNDIERRHRETAARVREY